MKRDILWSVDLSKSTIETQKQILPTLKSFAKSWNCQIQPVFVINNRSFYMNVDTFLNLSHIDQGEFETSLFKEFNFSEEDETFKPGKLIISESFTRLGLVQSLLNYAKESKALAIACCTRTRSQFYPSFLGGFTESLLNHSQIPILSIHPEIDQKENFQSIMYTTQLEEENDSQFEKVVDLALSMNAKLKVFFNFQNVSQSLYVAPQFPSKKVYETLLENDKKVRALRQENGEKLLEQARQKGVDAELVI